MRLGPGYGQRDERKMIMVWAIEDGDLSTRAGGYEYVVPGSLIDSDAKAWRLIDHVADKSWATDEVVGSLVRAVQAVRSSGRGSGKRKL